MNGSATLERRYRRLLAAFPAGAPAGGLMLTLPRPVALRLLLLLAMPALPCAAWVVQFWSHGFAGLPFPALLVPPVLLLLCAGALSRWRAGRSGGSAR